MRILVIIVGLFLRLSQRSSIGLLLTSRGAHRSWGIILGCLLPDIPLIGRRARLEIVRESVGLWDITCYWPMVLQSRSIERSSRLGMVVRSVSLSTVGPLALPI